MGPVKPGPDPRAHFLQNPAEVGQNPDYPMGTPGFPGPSSGHWLPLWDGEGLTRTGNSHRDPPSRSDVLNGLKGPWNLLDSTPESRFVDPVMDSWGRSLLDATRVLVESFCVALQSVFLFLAFKAFQLPEPVHQ